MTPSSFIMIQTKAGHLWYWLLDFRKAQDASANRYIMEIDCGEPFERNGLEWVLIKIKGKVIFY